MHILRPRWLLWLLLMLSSQTWAQSEQLSTPEPQATIWHVEVLLFAHADGYIAWREQEQLKDFRSLPVMPAVLTVATQQPVFSTSNSSDDSTEPFASAAMAAAWQSMQGEYELLGYYRWNQTDETVRRWRIHGEQVSSPPISLQEASPLAQIADATTDTDIVADADAADANVTLSEPHYVLDGSVKINTDDVGVADLNIRERSTVLYYRNELAADDADRDETSNYRVRKLQQRRRIQAERVEYFDSAGLAALVLISALPEADDEPDATDPHAVTRE